MTINTHNLVCDFGRHKGELYTRLPVNYLNWMVNSNHSKAEIAQEELKRRGTVTPTIEISGHAIDRASLSCRKIWHQTREQEEGLHAWLCRISMEALANDVQDNKGRHLYGQLILVFAKGANYPVLKTIMRRKIK